MILGGLLCIVGTTLMIFHLNKILSFCVTSNSVRLVGSWILQLVQLLRTFSQVWILY